MCTSRSYGARMKLEAFTNRASEARARPISSTDTSFDVTADFISPSIKRNLGIKARAIRGIGTGASNSSREASRLVVDGGHRRASYIL